MKPMTAPATVAGAVNVNAPFAPTDCMIATPLPEEVTPCSADITFAAKKPLAMPAEPKPRPLMAAIVAHGKAAAAAAAPEVAAASAAWGRGLALGADGWDISKASTS
jgi:hypothetical protein